MLHAAVGAVTRRFALPLEEQGKPLLSLALEQHGAAMQRKASGGTLFRNWVEIGVLGGNQSLLPVPRHAEGTPVIAVGFILGRTMCTTPCLFHLAEVWLCAVWLCGDQP